MQQNVSRVKPQYLFATLAVGGVVFVAINVNDHPPFSSLDQFVLVASEDVHIADNTQVSSGDIATNGILFIAKENIINSNFFANEVRIAENSSINGNASFNSLHLADGASILGTTTSPLSLPMIAPPEIPPFQVGNTRLIADQEQTIQPGSYDSIEAKEDATLTLEPGIYNLNTLNVRTGAQVLFSSTTIVNIRQSLSFGSQILVAQTDNTVESTALRINYAGNKPVTIGDNSFVSAQLLAPNSKVLLGEQTTARGQIIAKSIHVGEGGLLSREDFFEKESDLRKVVIDESGNLFFVNEIIILFADEATLQDIQAIIGIIEGEIAGAITDPNIFKIQVPTNTVSELDAAIAILENLGSPLVIEITKNVLGDLP